MMAISRNQRNVWVLLQPSGVIANYSMISQTALHQAARVRCHGCHKSGGLFANYMYIARTQHKRGAEKLPERGPAVLRRFRGGAGLGSQQVIVTSGAGRDASVPF
jgi:hypothetical protein